MLFILKSFGAASLGILLTFASGCVSNRGAAEFETYRLAFQSASTASTSILDQLAVQERALFLKSEPDRARLKFDPDLAAYYTHAVDPPATAAFRNAFHTVVIYNDILYGLSSGQTSEVIVAKIGAMNTSLRKAAEGTSALAGSSLPQLAAIGVTLETAFIQVRPFVQMAATARSSQRFRYYVITYYPAVRNILVALRRSTREIFTILNAQTLNRIRASPSGGASDDLEKIGKYRELLADWVVMLDSSITSLDRVEAAALNPVTPIENVAGLTAAAVDLETASQAARRSLAELGAH